MSPTKTNDKPAKPLLRGVSHSYAAIAAASAGIMLCLDAKSSRALFGCIVYALSTTVLFTTSATYHTVTWGPKGRLLMKRADHAAIFLLIAGTYTPLTLLALESAASSTLLPIVWAGTFAGIIQCLFFPHVPKSVAALLYVGLGWTILPYAGQLNTALGALNVVLLVAGGVSYTFGAVIYAMERPDIVPHVFGYHELFHAFVILAAVLHFSLVYRVVNAEVV